jgi:hypothetical protein
MQGTVEAPLATVRWFDRFIHNDVSMLPARELASWAQWASHEAHLRQFRRVRAISCSLPISLARVPKRTDADIAADEYGGSDHGSRTACKRDDLSGRSGRWLDS